MKTNSRQIQSMARWLLAAILFGAGVLHLTSLRQEFQTQVPAWFPLDVDLVVVTSGLVEILLGLLLAFAPAGQRRRVGWLTAAFFVAIFPGNIAQLVEGTDAFGLDTDLKRFLRLFGQPVLVAWALWATGVLRRRRA